jgi:transmembrane sensor
MATPDPRSPLSDRRSPRASLSTRYRSVWRKVRPLLPLTVPLLRVTIPFVLLLGNVTPSGSRYYSTDIGEQLTLKLKGAKLTLNTNSLTSVRETPACLTVQLFQGEVLLDIAHRPGRCVEVWAGNARIRDIGTQFDIFLADDKVTVTVIEGALELAQVDARGPSLSSQFADSIILQQGDRGEVLRHSPAHRPTSQKLDMSRILSDISWERGELIFDSNTVQEIAQQFNRYNRRPQIQIQDAALASRRISGVFRSRDPESFIAGLQQVESRVRVIRPNNPDGNIILTTVPHRN